MDRHLYTYNTHYTHYTQITPLHPDLIKLYDKIHNSEIIGRNLELFFPIIITANFIDESMVDEVIRIAKELTKEKKHDEHTESRDVMLLDFVSRYDSGLTFIPVKRLLSEFKTFTDEDEEWLNGKWLGRAIKRLNIVIDKRRLSGGTEVILNSAKAIEKLKMFKAEEQEKDKK